MTTVQTEPGLRKLKDHRIRHNCCVLLLGRRQSCRRVSSSITNSVLEEVDEHIGRAVQGSQKVGEAGHIFCK